MRKSFRTPLARFIHHLADGGAATRLDNHFFEIDVMSAVEMLEFSGVMFDLDHQVRSDTADGVSVMAVRYRLASDSVPLALRIADRAERNAEPEVAT